MGAVIVEGFGHDYLGISMVESIPQTARPMTRVTRVTMFLDNSTSRYDDCLFAVLHALNVVRQAGAANPSNGITTRPSSFPPLPAHARALTEHLERLDGRHSIPYSVFNYHWERVCFA